MHEVTTFQYQSHQFRSLTIDGEPWFVANDICEVLCIKNARKAMSKIPEQHKGVTLSHTLGGRQQVNIVSEPGMYRLILRSNKPEAEPFIEWVTAEVLPAIRKTGSYCLAESPPDKVVDIRHFRSTPSPSGLDIRYTLDLTRIILKPRRTSLRILERITGLQVADILEDMPDEVSDATTDLLRMFVRMRCRPVSDEERVPLKDLHAAYVDWFREAGHKAGLLGSNKRLSAYLRDKGYVVRTVGGLAWVYGIALRQEVTA